MSIKTFLKGNKPTFIYITHVNFPEQSAYNLLGDSFQMQKLKLDLFPADHDGRSSKIIRLDL